jgi:hypothetical protein
MDALPFFIDLTDIVYTVLAPEKSTDRLGRTTHFP